MSPHVVLHDSACACFLGCVACRFTRHHTLTVIARRLMARHPYASLCSVGKHKSHPEGWLIERGLDYDVSCYTTVPGLSGFEYFGGNRSPQGNTFCSDRRAKVPQITPRSLGVGGDLLSV